MADIKPFLFKTDEDGNQYAIDNPEYQIYIQNTRYKLFLERSGIPEFYWNIEFKDFIGNKKSVEYRKILHYAEHLNEKAFEHVHLYLWGIGSTQKTALACNIGKSAIRKGLKVKFILAGDLIDSMMKIQGYSNDLSLIKELEDLKNNYDLIIVDDIADPDKAMMWNSSNRSLIVSEWDRLFRKILYNHSHVVMTSNFSIENCKQYFSESVFAMLDRNSEKLHLTESVKEIRKLKVQSAFEGII